jgi:CRISPR/Cas system-associated exonuclease Cas4 (RecB family)
VILTDGKVLTVDAARKKAVEEGFLDGIPSQVVMMLLEEREIKNPTMSIIFSGAIRKTVLEKLYPYTATLMSKWAAVKGTLMHSGQEHYPEPADCISEKRFYYVLNGLKFGGQIDKYYPDSKTLRDIKTIKSIPKTPWGSHVGQINGYRWLMQKNGYEVDKMEVFYISWDDARLLDVSWMSDDLVEHKLITLGGALIKGIQERVIPPKSMCQPNFCSFCNVREICEDLDFSQRLEENL